MEKDKDIVENNMNILHQSIKDLCPSGTTKNLAIAKLREAMFYVHQCFSMQETGKETLKELGVCAGCTVSKAGCGATGGWDEEGYPITWMGNRIPCKNV